MINAEREPSEWEWFEWWNRRFDWRHGNWAGFVSSDTEDGSNKWTADVHSRGWQWVATIRFSGGEQKGEGVTPQDALNHARHNWLNQVKSTFEMLSDETT